MLNNGRINQERISLYFFFIFSNYLIAAAAYSEKSGLRSFHLTWSGKCVPKILQTKKSSRLELDFLFTSDC